MGSRPAVLRKHIAQTYDLFYFHFFFFGGGGGFKYPFIGLQSTNDYDLSYFSLDFGVKKEGWGGGGSRMIKFVRGQGDVPILKPSGKTLTVTIGSGLPKDSSKCCRTCFLPPLPM